MTRAQIVASYVARGFDRTTVSGRRPRRVIAPRCSQCAALVINGVACHETGCPHQVYPCRGCDATVPRPGQYCADCQ